MTPNMNPGNHIEPLNVGNVVSAAVLIYRSHFKSYFSIALIATLWVLLPILTLIPILLGLFFTYGRNQLPLFLWLLVPIWLLLLVYCIAKYIVNSVLIARLAFGELITQPENVNTARSYVNPRMWLFVLATLLTSLIVVGIEFAVLMVIFFAGVTLGVFGAGAAVRNPGIIAILVLLGIISFIACLALISWLGMRFCLLELPIAIENNVGPVAAIGRSWELTKGYVWQIFLVYIVAYLVSLPIVIITRLVTSIITSISPSISSSNSSAVTLMVPLFLISAVIGLLSNILILPFWQIVKAIIYYDLRSRREGFGLQLRNPGY